MSAKIRNISRTYKSEHIKLTEMGKLIKHNGDVEDVDYADGNAYTHAQLQLITNSFHPVIIMSKAADDDRVLVIDRDAQKKEKLYNGRATRLLRQQFLVKADVAGDALLCHHYELD